MSLLLAEQIVKDYSGHRALDDVSIEVPKESIFGLLGPNGAGKTSLIRIINQITAPDSGRIVLDGTPLKPEHIEQIGYLPEERGLYKKMKVGEQALYLARLKGMSTSDAKAKLKDWFKRMDMIDWWDKKVEELSKGMAQKVQFITTVLHEPKLLIFDEPFSGFDPINANLIKDEIMRLRERGSTVIFSTHRMESVEEMCDHIALINKSKKILDGKLSKIKEDYKNGIFKVEFHRGTLPTELSADMVVLEQDSSSTRIQLTNGASSNDLLQKLLPSIQIDHFSEVVPTVNDIFIRTVQNAAS
ncbi:MAG: ATP-binding cassette domain-containing protein [Flavobacteriales bacterium]|nr:ATP-binding cassette domain-containing protein [Flavobacteriales bacterium]